MKIVGVANLREERESTGKDAAKFKELPKSYYQSKKMKILEKILG